MTIKVTSGVMATLRKEAARTAPDECCGLLLGSGQRIKTVAIARNVSPEPRTRFEIDPLALFAAHKAARAGGPQVLGYFHSHPSGHPVPSATDCEHSTGDLRIWAIVAGDEVAFWRDSGNGFTSLSCQVVER
ncbi:M67 family metallopeptidase [Novosphingobium sp. M1R2S20]|uniref:M67 family metallopeptidase n=1 Tax=Novosphingobium rhizovicinum TaxID=3228928 RepID=A0ABV3R7X6_9SPHN